MTRNEYTVHATDRDGNDYAIPGVTDVAFITFPNGEAGLAFSNPYGDDMTLNLERAEVREVTPGYSPGGEPCYHRDGPTYLDGHQPPCPTERTRTHEAFRDG